MSTAKRALYAGVGASAIAVERVRDFPKRVIDLPSQISKTYGDLTSRGEKVVKRVSRSAPTKRAIEQTKVARSRVKAAATTIRKVGRTNGETVEASADTFAG